MSATYLIITVDGICWAMLLTLTASGMALALRAAGTLNLAHGTAYLAGAYLAWTMSAHGWTGVAAALAAAAAAGAAAGAGLAAVTAPLAGHLQQALATVGVALIGGHLLLLGYGPDPLTVPAPPGLAGSVTIAGQPYPAYRLTFLITATAIVAAVWWWLHHTHTGMIVRAAADDPTALALHGHHPARTRAVALAAATALAATAGVLGAPVQGPVPGLDHQTLTVSLIVVVAARASIARTLPAALAVGQLHTTAMTAWPHAAPLLPYLLLPAALLGQQILTTRSRRLR